jgi:hypothetical protein
MRYLLPGEDDNKPCLKIMLGIWTCMAVPWPGCAVGTGDTPQQAYEDWKRQRHE